MDNLGEAQAVHNKTWPPDKPTGHDPAVLQTLPRILDILAKAAPPQLQHPSNNSSEDDNRKGKDAEGGGGIRATYFAEAWSLGTYPAAVADLQHRGHEVAWHGFQHEVWHSLSPDEEEKSFERSFNAAAEAGVVYKGFRPPGGRINGDRTVDLFRRYGVEYVSPLGQFGIQGGGDGVVVLPFEWEAVDAFWYMDKFAGVRREHGVHEEVGGPGEFGEYLRRRIEAVKAEGGYLSVLFHPFLTTDEERMGLLSEIVNMISGDDEVWCAPCGEVAGWVRDHRAEFGF